MYKKSNLWCLFLAILWVSTACASSAIQTTETKPTSKATEISKSTLEHSQIIPTNTAPPNSSTQSGDLPKFETLPDGWSSITLEYPASCARGTPYTFFTRKTNSDDLLIYFEGGGSCASAETCRIGSQSFDDSIDPKFESDNPALKTTGVFALDDARNPFQNFNMVFISYCTGDAFLGQKTVTYNDQGNEFELNHHGAINTQEVLNWIFDNFKAPEKISIIGCSAGVIGSAFHAPAIFEKYPTIRMSVIGDSGAGFFNAPIEFLAPNGSLDLINSASLDYQAGFGNNTFDVTKFFTIPANQYPHNTIALVDTFSDATQKSIIENYNYLIGQNITLEEVIRNNLKTLQTDAPTIRAFSGPGDFHCITMRPEFFKYQVNDTLLVNWVTDLANGEEVQNILP